MTSLAGPREAGARCPCCNVEVALHSPMVICPECGAVHHRACWDGQPGCGSYLCKPARRRFEVAPVDRLVITADELQSAIPARPRPLAPGAIPARPPAAERPGVHRLAVASLITAVVGIPLFGIVTGFVAIVLACLALSRIPVSRQRGVGLALGGLLIGVADMAGWAAFLSQALTGQAGVLLPEPGEPELTTDDVSPKIYRAMRANVMIDRRSGWNGMATGSGVILDVSDGGALIVTNRHIVDPGFPSRTAPPDLDGLDGDALSVKLLNGPARRGRVTWVAPDGIDLALLRVEVAPGEAEPARWVRGRPMRIGDAVFAIGNPQRLSWTHTQGVISQFRTMSFNGRSIRVIQTQAAINPGNSGGGLYDDASNLIGIITWTKDKRTSEGLSFAISFDSLLALDPPGLAARGADDDQKGLKAP